MADHEFWQDTIKQKLERERERGLSSRSLCNKRHRSLRIGTAFVEGEEDGGSHSWICRTLFT